MSRPNVRGARRQYDSDNLEAARAILASPEFGEGESLMATWAWLVLAKIAFQEAAETWRATKDYGGT